MCQFNLNLNKCPPELRQGLAEIQLEYPQCFASKPTSPLLTFIADTDRQGGLSVSKSRNQITVQYGRKTDAFRALGRLLGEQNQSGINANYSEKCRFDMLGVMIDVSRNGVLRPETAKALIRRCALMGINVFMFYSEDTYEVPGEPFFGYLRGRYTQKEMKDIDDYADIFGIEMFPCIQVLGHLEQVLQWPAYAEYRDTKDILLAEDKKTYRLIEKMITAASAPFRSRRIHLGMDETHGLGSGNFRKRAGDKNPYDIFNNHLKKMLLICKRLHLKPMIWSDMYFRLGSKTNDYYDRNLVIPKKVIANIPKEVELVYWDYHQLDQAFYEEWIDRHRALGSEPIMAGGVRTSYHLWTALPFSFNATDVCMKACKKKGLRQAFVTLWGDDGMECDVFSALPGIQFFAEHGYANHVDPKLLRANFRGSCNAEFDDWVEASQIDSVPIISEPDKNFGNTSKWLLWQDPLLSLMDPYIENPIALKLHYEQLAEKLIKSARKETSSIRLMFPALIARAVAAKCVMRHNLLQAYRTQNRRQLQRVEEDLRELRKDVRILWKYHRNLWLDLYKPFGLEVLEHRYGGVLARLESLSDRLHDYIKGKTKSIPELETELKKCLYSNKDIFKYSQVYSRVSTPSFVK